LGRDFISIVAKKKESIPDKQKMKITKSSKKITPFGGFNFCHKLLNDTCIGNLIDERRGSRVKYAGFDYSDIFMNHLAIFLIGGDSTEDIQEHRGDHLRQVRWLSVQKNLKCYRL